MDLTDSGIMIIVLLLLTFVVVLFETKVKPAQKAKKRYGKKELIGYGKFKPLLNPGFPQCEQCEVICLKSRILIVLDNYELSVATEKLVDVSVWREEKVHKEFYSGLYNRPKLLTKVIKTDYLTITYLSDEKTRSMTFNVTGNTMDARMIERKYLWLKKKNKQEAKRKSKEDKNKERIKIDL